MSISFDNGNIVLAANGFTTTLVPSATNDCTITLPNATTVIATTGGEDVLTNKSLVAGACFIIDDEDPTKKMQIRVGGIEKDTTLVISSPNVTTNCQFVCLTSTDELSNKTLTDATNNVIARGVWFGSGTGSISTYDAKAPGRGQVLVATSETTAEWQTPTGSVGGSDTQVQFNSGGTTAGAAGLTIAGDGYAVIGDSTGVPSTPSSGAKLYARSRTGRRMASQIGPTGIDYSFQPMVGMCKVSWWTAHGGGSVVSAVGLNNNITGTATTRNPASSTLLVSTRRVGFVSTATAGSSSGTRHGAQQFWRGDAPGRGGFHYIARFGMSSASNVTTQRTFVGLIASTTVNGNSDPSAINSTPLLGFGVDSADSGWFFMRNDNAGQPTKTGLTGTFPPRDLSVSLFEAHIFCAPNSSTIQYSLEVLGGGSFFAGSVSDNMPSPTTFLSPQIWTNNGSTAAAVGIDVISQYIETDY